MPHLKVQDADIYYEVHGEGAPIIFAHGLGGNHISWWQQIPFFRERYKCITFAARGFYPSLGKAEPARNLDDLSALIEHLALDRIVLVAQSMGTWASSAYALRQPERVRGLVMASGFGIFLRPDLDSSDEDHSADLRRRGIHPAAGERMSREQPALHYLYKLIDGLTPGLDKEGIRPLLFAERNQDVSVLAQLPVPVMFIWGREDNTDAEIEWLRTEFPDRRIEIVANTGHSVYFERPETFNDLVADFLQRLPA